jgi:hypothetical protein
VRPEGKYTIFVTAYYDIPLSITSVNAQGEIDDGGPDLYYLATASDDRMHQGKTVQVTIDDALTTASVKGSLRSVSCTDEDGKPVTGSRCPIGQRVEVTATWGNAQAMEDVGPADAAGTHVGRGRKCSATATIGSDSYTTQNASGSQLDYGLITEAPQRQGPIVNDPTRTVLESVAGRTGSGGRGV